jgi:predicted PurR-regulated permease PerM
MREASLEYAVFFALLLFFMAYIPRIGFTMYSGVIPE